jgi:hypothetical protein
MRFFKGGDFDGVLVAARRLDEVTRKLGAPRKWPSPPLPRRLKYCADPEHQGVPPFEIKLIY